MQYKLNSLVNVMLNITPIGFDNYIDHIISIPFSAVKSENDLKNLLKSKYNLYDGVLVFNYNTSQLDCYFDEPYLVKSDKSFDIDYINIKKCVLVNVELFDKNTTLYMYIDDNLKNALFSLHFLFKNRKYRFTIDNEEIDVNNKLVNIIDFNKMNTMNVYIKVTLIE